jgi:hypothetical protein
MLDGCAMSRRYGFEPDATEPHLGLNRGPEQIADHIAVNAVSSRACFQP